MKFNKLRVLGFKSFVEPMEFVIGDGLTGVVGPNGCGKSNLVEALRWVMGENSYKNMRASGMDDVIFSGSLNRPARNTAEVTLFLDNADRTAPSGFNDADTLEVTRRIERESGSNYKINSRDVRARDVQLLFADASTGARSPALVRQGQIGELIAAKPTSRRQILEEAAGISGLHSRRHEAELRLRAAELNLERLEDVLVQIDGQLDSLRRQARQASRFRNLSAEIRSAEAALYYLRWLDCRDRLKAAEAEFAEAENGVREIAALQAEAAKAQAIAAHKVPEARDAAARAGAAVQRLVLARNELDGEERRVRERLSDLAGRLQQLHQDIAREQALISENDAHLALLAEEEEELRGEALAEAEGAAEAAMRVEAANEAVQAAEERLAALTGEQAAREARRRQLREAHQAAVARAERIGRQHGEAAAQLADLEARIEDAPDLELGREALLVAEERLDMAEERALAAEERTRAGRAGLEAARAPLAGAEADLSRLETEARTLAEVLAAGQAGDWPPVVDAMTAVPGYETALGAALGEDLDAPLGGDAPMRWSEAGAVSGDGDPPLPEGAEPLSRFVRAPGALARRLAQIGVVADGDGERLRPLLRAGQRLVGRDGAVWRWDGFTIAADAPTAAAQRLARKNRLAALEGEIAGAAARIEALRAGFAEAEATLARADVAEAEARQEVKAARGAADAARQEVLRLERAHAEAEARLSGLRDNAGRLAADLDEAREAVEAASLALAGTGEEGDLSRTIDAARAEAAEARATLSRERAEADGGRRARP